MATNGAVLAVAIGYRPPLGKNLAIPKSEGGVVLLHQGAPPIRTPLRVGTIRTIVAAPSGFVAGRVIYGKDANCTTCCFEIDLKGQVTEMPQLGIDLVDLWATADGTIYACSTRAIFRWIKSTPVWERLPLDPAVSAEAIRQVVALKDGSSLVVTDHLIKGFRSLQKPPVFIKELHAYPEVLTAYGDDRWWIVANTKDGRAQKISLVDKDGDTKEIDPPPVWLINQILFGTDKAFITCVRERNNIHKNSYYVLNRDGSGTPRGPFMLPEDTTEVCLWGDSIVSAGGEGRIYKTETTSSR